MTTTLWCNFKGVQRQKLIFLVRNFNANISSEWMSCPAVTLGVAQHVRDNNLNNAMKRAMWKHEPLLLLQHLPSPHCTRDLLINLSDGPHQNLSSLGLRSIP